MTGLQTFRQVMQNADLPNIVNPATGEVVDLQAADHPYLVDVFIALQQAEKQLREWRTQAEDELVRRHGDRRAAQVVGDHEVDVARGYTRVWDAEDLIETVSDLVGRGLLSVMDAQGLVRDEPKVDGIVAAKLINRLEKAVAQLNREDDEALLALRRCFKWKEGRARVKVTPVAELEA